MSAPQTPADVLRAARKLIEKPEAWTQGAAARNRHRGQVYPHFHSAVCWCALGAIWNQPSKISFATIEAFLRRAIDRSDIANWNDAPGRTHAEVLAAFDRAIAFAEAHK